VPLAEVKGSGPKGRVTQDDLQGFVKQVMSGAVQTAAQKAKAPAAAAGTAAGGAFPGLLAWPQVDFAKFGPVERKELGRIKKISGANLHRNWVLIPHVTNHDDATSPISRPSASSSTRSTRSRASRSRCWPS
jgi:pyruvate dehydrogenase E2 component (dihydrolipoamide acetyltransferase)